jgi:hypothetical protein
VPETHTGPGDRPGVLYIAGAGRSGSTVVARYLEAAVDACHVGELRYVWSRGVDERQLCECGEPFGQCHFWSAVLAGAYPDGVAPVRERMAVLSGRVDRLRHVPGNIAVARGRRDSADVEAYADCLVPMYQQVLRVSGSPVVIDSSKDPSYLFALHATGRIDLRVLHLVRDSRAVAFSWTRVKSRPEVHWEDQVMTMRRPTLAARRWMENNLAVELFGRVGPPVHRLRYEDFATDPEAVTSHLVGELSLERRTGPVPDPGHSFSGNPIRFDRTPLRVRPDTAWTTQLDPRERRKVAVISFPLLKKYGYPLW